MSALQISCRITGTTRSSILGKLKRLRDGGNTVRARAKNPNPVRQRRHRAKPDAEKKIVLKAPVKPEPIVEISDNDIPLEQRVDIMGLTNRTCRWPCNEVGTPEFFFCGSLEADNSSGVIYCGLHTRRATGRSMTQEERRELRGKIGPATLFGQR